MLRCAKFLANVAFRIPFSLQKYSLYPSNYALFVISSKFCTKNVKSVMCRRRIGLSLELGAHREDFFLDNYCSKPHNFFFTVCFLEANYKEMQGGLRLLHSTGSS